MEQLRDFGRWLFSTPRKALTTIAVIAILVVMLFPSIFDRLWNTVLSPLLARP